MRWSMMMKRDFPWSISIYKIKPMHYHVFNFTNILSIKLMKMEKVSFGVTNNIILDSENDFYNTDNKNKIYPVVVDLYKHKIRGINYISPSQKYSIEELLKNE